jgi:hypothetical protein
MTILTQVCILHCCLQLFCVVMELLDAVGVDCVHVINNQTKLRTLNALRLATVKDSFPVWIELMVSTYTCFIDIQGYSK